MRFAFAHPHSLFPEFCALLSTRVGLTVRCGRRARAAHAAAVAAADAALVVAETRYTEAIATVEAQRSQVAETVRAAAAAAAAAEGGGAGAGGVEEQVEAMEEVLTLLREKVDEVHCRPATLARARETLERVRAAVEPGEPEHTPGAEANGEEADEAAGEMAALSRRILTPWCALCLGRLERLAPDAPTPPAVEAEVRAAVDGCSDKVDALALLFFSVWRGGEVESIPNRRRALEAVCQAERLQDAIDAIAASRSMPHLHAQRRLLTLVCERLEDGFNALTPHAVDRTRSSSAAAAGLAAVPPGSFLCSAAGADAVTLQWAPPRDAHGRPLPILGYELLVRKQGDDGDWTTCDADIPPTQTAFRVRGVAPATEYRFKLRVQAESGEGPWSLLRGVRTGALPPPPPERLRVTEVTHASAVLRWLRPRAAAGGGGGGGEGGEHPDSYDLEMQAGSGGWQSFPRTVRQTAVRKMHLEPDTLYRFRVRAHLPSAGWGPWSHEAEARTLRLDAVVGSLRTTARRRARESFRIREPQPLPTTAAPHLPMPRFQRSSAGARPGTAEVASPVSDPSSRLGLFLRRGSVLQDTFDALAERPPRDLVRGTLVHFEGEPGLDYGGLTREWLVLLLESFVDPSLALFSPVGSAQLSHPNPASRVQRDHLVYFRLFGRALAKAFLEGVTVPARLSSVVIKALLQRHGGYLPDLQQHDTELHRSLSWMLSNDITGVLDETFTADTMVLGRVESVELVPGGRGIKVTEENKVRFVEVRARHAMLHGISDQLQALVDGFTEVRPAHHASVAYGFLSLCVSADVSRWSTVFLCG